MGASGESNQKSERVKPRVRPRRRGAPTPALPRKREREKKAPPDEKHFFLLRPCGLSLVSLAPLYRPSPACGGGLGWGNAKHSLRFGDARRRGLGDELGGLQHGGAERRGDHHPEGDRA